MIEFPEERVRRVRKLLEKYDPDEEDAYEPIHRALAQSFKVVRLKLHAMSLMKAILHLFTGESEDLEAGSLEGGLALVDRLFGGEKRFGVGHDLMLKHATRLMSVEESKKDPNKGYIDFEDDHLVLIGGVALLLAIVRALVAPYEHRESRAPGMLTYRQAVLTDLAMWMRPEIIRTLLDAGYRHWQFWEDSLPRDMRK